MRSRRQGPPASTEPIALSRILDEAVRQLEARTSRDIAADSLLFSGNRHESVPRALFADPRLTPLERNAWQVLRMQLRDDGLTTVPLYSQLRLQLTSMPYAASASDETVARALTLLRLARWLTLARRRRNTRTGRIEGNLYVLHDEPLTPYESIQLDADYLSLVGQALIHASKAVQCVACQVLKEISEDSMLAGRVLPSRLQTLSQRLAQSDWMPCPSSSTAERADPPPSSDSEEGSNAEAAPLRNPKKEDRTVRTDDIYQSVRTVPVPRETLHLPQRFAELRAEQQMAACAALKQVEASLRQAVLDEWDARCRQSKIRNPAGYLFGIIQKAIRGDFRAWAGLQDAKGL